MNLKNIPYALHRPCMTEHSLTRKIRTAQSTSTTNRTAPVTLPKAPWIKEERAAND